MLDFWYSERCTRQIKLILCIGTCILIFICSEQAQLAPIFVGLCLVIGLMIDVLYTLRINRLKALPQALKWCLAILPILCLLCLIYFLPNEMHGLLVLQCISFTLIGFFLVSIYSHRAKRFD